MMLAKIFQASIATTALISFSHSALSDTGIYGAEFKQAEKNLTTPGGAQYDQSLEAYFNSKSKIRPALERCLSTYFKTHSVFPELQGYFRFSSSGDYRLVLQPEGELAACFSMAYAGYSPPPPPERPYVNKYYIYAN